MKKRGRLRTPTPRSSRNQRADQLVSSSGRLLRCSHGLGLFAPEVHELSRNGFRNGLEQELHVLQLWPSLIQPVSSQRRQTGSLCGGGGAVLTTVVSSLSRFPIAVVSSMIDPFIVFSSSLSGLAPICLRRGYPTAPDSIARLDRARGRLAECFRLVDQQTRTLRGPLVSGAAAPLTRWSGYISAT